MIVCPTCGAELPSGARFCPKDGTTVGDASGEATVSAKGKDEDPIIGRTIDGRYRVRARLGAGGVGAVYEGEHVEIKKPVAIKVLHGVFATTEEFRRRFEREARAASRLDHPSCVTVMDFGRVQRLEPMEGGVNLLGIPYLVMEFVRGQTLIDRLAEGPLPVGEAVRVALGVLQALRHAHGLGIIHRDVKPANVMLIPDDGQKRAKLLDFGLAKDLGGPEGPKEEESLTQAGTVFGTPSYLSPEQAAGGKADARSDLYSAGVMLFEMVCGRRPFIHDDPLDVVRDHLNTPPPRPRSLAPAISSALEEVIVKALAKQPATRFSSAEEMAAALSQTPEAGASSAVIAPPPPTMARLRRWPWRYAAMGAAPLLVLGLILLVWKRPAPATSLSIPPPPPAESEVSSKEARDAQAKLALAGDYQRKLWCSDALEELEKALRLDPGLSRDPQVTRIAIACLTPKTRSKAIRFLVERVGAQAKEPLEIAASGDENSEIRSGAQRALSRLAGNPAGGE